MKTKALISFAVTAKLICVFVFAYAKSRFSHDAAQIGMCYVLMTHSIMALYFPQTQHHHLAAEIYQRYISSSTSVVKIDKSIARRMEAFMLGNSVGCLSIEPGSEKTCL